MELEPENPSANENESSVQTEESTPKPSKGRRIGKILLYTFLLLVLAGGGIGYYYYNQIFGENVDPSQVSTLTIGEKEFQAVEIPLKSDLEAVAKLLESKKIIKDQASFLFTAEWMKYKGKAGLFEIPQNVKNNRELIKILRGPQVELDLTFHNLRKTEHLAGHIAPLLQDDSTEIAELFQDKAYLQERFGYTPETLMSLFIPNTYKIHWTYNGIDFLERMVKEHKKFWDKDGRREKAANLGLTPTEVYTIASIVETESQYAPERPTIAGVYLNRLKKGWKLEADPTVIFAHDDFTIRRVLFRHLEIDSPYNTYRNEGIPPGPIYMASISSIDAVLNYEKHDYMFFCAKPYVEGQPKTHAFAETGAGHSRNVAKWKRFLRTIM